jgi:hemoglobin
MMISEPQSLNPYDLMGGEEAVRRLVRRFYEIMDEAPEAWEIRKLHAQDLSGSEDKLFKFLSGWLGGPSLYIEEYGHPMLRKRHLPFKIGARERDQWMMCMKQALDEVDMDPLLRDQLKASLYKVADHMRNQLT